MSRYGWAYVNSIVTGAAVIGPDRGVVLNEGGYASASTNFSFSGSTGSINGQLNITGNVIVSGTLFAQQYSSTIVSSSIIYTSGSTKFGDDASDTHQFTGSLLNTALVSSSLGRFGTLTGSIITSSLATINNVTASFITASNAILANTLTASSITASNAILANTITGSTFSINGGAIDNTKIGETTQASGKFTTLSASNNLDVGGQITTRGNLIVSGGATLGDNNADIIIVNGQITGSFFAITGGTINNTAIGNIQQQGGRFTSLSASSTFNVVGVSNLNGKLTVNNDATLGATTSSAISIVGHITASNGLRLVGGKRIELTDPAGANVKAYVDGNTGEISASSNMLIGSQLTVNGQANFNAGVTGSAFDINGGTIDNTSIGGLTQSSGRFTTLSASSNLNVVGDITGSNLLIDAIFGGVRSKTFTAVSPGVSNADTTTDSDFIMLYNTSTTAGTVTLHNPIQSGKILIIRKTSNLNNITLTCSVGGVLFDKDNANTAGTGIVITAGTETNKMFVNSGTNWYEIFAGG